MLKLLNNPYIVGCSAGLVAAIAHYVNVKIIKKKEEIDYNEIAKVFITISLLAGGGMFLYQKKGNALLKGGSVNTDSSVQSAPVPNNANVPSVNATSNSVENITPKNLEISDINDVIHTGMPGF